MQYLRAMRTERAPWVTLGVLGLTTALVLADVKSSPYETIVSRNPFGLKPPPPPPDPSASQPPAPPTPMPTTKLTGITTILAGKPKAILEITEPGGKGPKQRILQEGERLDTIEVVSINVASNLVKVRIGDTETNLTFASAETAKTAGPPGAPGVVPGAPPFKPPGFPTVPGIPMPAAIRPAGAAVPGASPSSVFVAGGGGSGGAPATGSRSAVTTFGAASPTPATGTGIPPVPAVGTYGTPTPSLSTPGGVDMGLRTIPTRQMRTDQMSPQGANGRPMTREEVDMLIELNRVRKPANAPPLPPTSLSSMIDHPDTKYFPPSMQQPQPAQQAAPNQ
jgi:hypothetical protein